MNCRPIDLIYQRAEEALAARNLREAEKLSARILQSTKSEIRAHVLWARILAAKGQLHRAIRYLRSLKGDPGPALNQELGRLHHAAGQLQQARLAFTARVQQCPDDADTWLRLADVCYQQGRLTQAAEACDQAISQQPDNAEGYLRLGQILQRRHRTDQSIAVFRQGLTVLPDSPDLLCSLGVALLTTGPIDSAIEVLSRCLQIKPVHHTALFNLGAALMQSGDFAAAEQRLGQALKLRPALADAWYKLVHCRRQDTSDHRHADQIKLLLGRTNLVDQDRARLGFALGKALDDAADHQAAFAAFNEANAIRAQSLDYSDSGFGDRVDRIISNFRFQPLEQSEGTASNGQNLVFIVGLPRSGAALLNQILCAHSNVSTIGANDRAEQAKQRIAQICSGVAPYPDCVQSLGAEQLNELALRFLEGAPVTGQLITDTSSSNFLDLGLLKLLFPAARIVHLTRNPRDLCLSMFFSDLADVHNYAFDLDHLVAIHSQYQRLIDHWSSLWPEQMHGISYERLVSHFDTEIEAVLDFLGLQSEPACDHFHTRKNRVDTASSWSVRQPLFSSSVGRWRNYQALLGPLGNLPPGSQE